VNPLSPHDLISTLGPWAMLLVLFAETGLLIGAQVGSCPSSAP
jgi:membrane-associated protein